MSKRSGVEVPKEEDALEELGVPLQIIHVDRKSVTSTEEQEEDGTTENKPKEKEEWEIKIKHENLRTLIMNLESCSVKEFCIISLLGQYRTGKSFLLDLMLKYLQAGGRDGWCEGTLEGDSVNNFTFRKQRERLTTGIWFYSKPFVRGGVAHILMDTQGLFDLQTPMEVNKAVFSLSTLISSHQILNIKDQLSEDVLQQLEFFTGFSKSALEINNQDVTEQIDVDGFKFQHLQFVVRDYDYYSDPTNFESCVQDMDEYVNRMFANNGHDDGTRENIQSMFDTIDGFGLVYPGGFVRQQEWDGNLDDVEDDFKINVHNFFNEIFNTNPVVKKPLFPGQTMSPKLLENYIVNFTEIFTSGELPEAGSLSQAFARSIHLGAKDNAIKTYEKQMSQFMASNDFFETTELEDLHEVAKSACLTDFQNKSKYGKQEERDVFLNEVQKYIEQKYEEEKQLNKARMGRLLAAYALPVVIAIVAFLFDKVTDWTCDGWVQTCDDISKLSFWTYSIVSGCLGYAVYQIYSKKGYPALYSSLAGLLADVGERMTNFIEKTKYEFKKLTNPGSVEQKKAKKS